MYKIFVRSRPPLRIIQIDQKLIKLSSMHPISDASLACPPTAISREVQSLSATQLKYADIGINLGDPVFQGIYHGKRAHECDLKDVIQRATAVGCLKMMITGSDLKQSRKAVKMAEDYRTLNN